MFNHCSIRISRVNLHIYFGFDFTLVWCKFQFFKTFSINQCFKQYIFTKARKVYIYYIDQTKPNLQTNTFWKQKFDLMLRKNLNMTKFLRDNQGLQKELQRNGQGGVENFSLYCDNVIKEYKVSGYTCSLTVQYYTEDYITYL